MDKKTAEKASKLLKTLERLEEIWQATEESKSHWWSFLTPDVKRLTDNDGLMMPEILRNEFKEAVERAIEKTKAKLDKL